MNALRTVLSNLLDHYVQLASSGDCGNWDPEIEDQVIAARKILAQPDPFAWVSMKDKIPPPDVELLVVFGVDRKVQEAHTFSRWKHPSNPAGYIIEGHKGSSAEVTHWMLKPAPPEVPPEATDSCRLSMQDLQKACKHAGISQMQTQIVLNELERRRKST